LRAARAAALSALLASLLATGCYKPNIKPGALKCATNGACPDDFKCNVFVTPAVCVPSSTVLSGGGAGGEGGQGGPGGAAGGSTATGGIVGTGGMDAGTPPCLSQVTPCAAGGTGMCDPVCNTGCGKCYQKCSVDPIGELTCNPVFMPGSPLLGVLAGPCQTMQNTSDPSTHTDNCQPGTACIPHNACGPRCYQFCRTNTDCQTNASCTIDAGGGNSFCDVPTIQCDPVTGAADKLGASGCPTSIQSCYISSETGNTLCDCYQGAGVPKGQPCAHARDCYPGLTCTDPFGGMGKKCFKVCRLPLPDGGVDPRANPNETGCDVGKCTPILLPNNAVTTVFGVCPE
jgi:hypothetical protein